MKPKNPATLEIFHVKESNNLIGWENFWPKAKKQTVKNLEMNESVYCFYRCLPMCKKSSSKLNLVLKFANSTF